MVDLLFSFKVVVRKIKLWGRRVFTRGGPILVAPALTYIPVAHDRCGDCPHSH